MNTKAAVAADDDPSRDPVALLAELEYRGKRHAENLDGLRKHEAHLTAEIASRERDLAGAEDPLAKLPPDAGAGAVFEARTTVVAIQFNRDLLKEQLAGLKPELAETPKLIAQNK